MGLSYRKSKKAGPFRFTVTNRGVSGSVGAKGARVSKHSSGRTTESVSLFGWLWRRSRS